MQVKCSACGLSFFNTTVLNFHVCGALPFKCLTCARHQGFTTQLLLDAHNVAVHPAEDDDDAGSGAVGTQKLSLFVNDCSAEHKTRDVRLMESLASNSLINPAHANNTKVKDEEKALVHLQPCIDELYHTETGLLRDYPKPDIATFLPRLSKFRTRMLNLYFERSLDKVVAPTGERDVTLKCLMENLCADRVKVFAANRAKRNSDEGGGGGPKKKAKSDKEAEAEAQAKMKKEAALGRVVLERNDLEKQLKEKDVLLKRTKGASDKRIIEGSILSLEDRLAAAEGKIKELSNA